MPFYKKKKYSPSKQQQKFSGQDLLNQSDWKQPPVYRINYSLSNVNQTTSDKVPLKNLRRVKSLSIQNSNGERKENDNLIDPQYSQISRMLTDFKTPAKLPRTFNGDSMNFETSLQQEKYLNRRCRDRTLRALSNLRKLEVRLQTIWLGHPTCDYSYLFVHHRRLSESSEEERFDEPQTSWSNFSAVISKRDEPTHSHAATNLNISRNLILTAGKGKTRSLSARENVMPNYPVSRNLQSRNPTKLTSSTNAKGLHRVLSDSAIFSIMGKETWFGEEVTKMKDPKKEAKDGTRSIRMRTIDRSKNDRNDVEKLLRNVDLKDKEIHTKGNFLVSVKTEVFYPSILVKSLNVK